MPIAIHLDNKAPPHERGKKPTEANEEDLKPFFETLRLFHFLNAPNVVFTQTITSKGRLIVAIRSNTKGNDVSLRSRFTRPVETLSRIFAHLTTNKSLCSVRSATKNQQTKGLNVRSTPPRLFTHIIVESPLDHDAVTTTHRSVVLVVGHFFGDDDGVIGEKLLPFAVDFVNFNKKTYIGLPTIPELHRLPVHVTEKLDAISQVVVHDADSALALGRLSEYHG
jgi:hypothetical protein